MPHDVHPQAQAVIDLAIELGIPKIQDLTTEAARALVEQFTDARREVYPSPEIFEVENTSTGPGYSHVPVADL